LIFTAKRGVNLAHLTIFRHFMKYLTLILCYSLTFFIQVSAQSTPPSGTEVVVPWALSFFTGKGASNLHFSDSLNGIAYWKHNPHYSLTSDGGKTWKDGKTTSSTRQDYVDVFHRKGFDRSSKRQSVYLSQF
jgi:hypothetical protein